MVAQIIELVDVQIQSGQEYLNVTHWVDPDGGGDVDALLTDYHDNIVPLMQAMQHTSLTHTGLRYREVYPTAGLQAEQIYGTALAGTDGNEPAPSFQTLSFKFAPVPTTTVLSGGFTGHIKRGGMHVGGVTVSGVGGNVVDAGLITAGAALGTGLLATQGGTFDLCIVSFLIGNKVRNGPPRARSHTVTAWCGVNDISAPSWSTQNSRKVLRGRVF